jgi:hypothetical protein
MAWKAPVAYPEDNKLYTWDENEQNWIEAEEINAAE